MVADSPLGQVEPVYLDIERAVPRPGAYSLFPWDVADDVLLRVEIIAMCAGYSQRTEFGMAG